MNIADPMHSTESSGSALMRRHTVSAAEPLGLPKNILAMNHTCPGSRWWQYPSVGFLLAFVADTVC